MVVYREFSFNDMLLYTCMNQDSPPQKLIGGVFSKRYITPGSSLERHIIAWTTEYKKLPLRVGSLMEHLQFYTALLF